MSSVTAFLRNVSADAFDNLDCAAILLWPAEASLVRLTAVASRWHVGADFKCWYYIEVAEGMLVVHLHHHHYHHMQMDPGPRLSHDCIEVTFPSPHTLRINYSAVLDALCCNTVMIPRLGPVGEVLGTAYIGHLLYKGGLVHMIGSKSARTRMLDLIVVGSHKLPLSYSHRAHSSLRSLSSLSNLAISPCARASGP